MGDAIGELIDEEKLPFDTFFRLASFGTRQVTTSDDKKTMQWMAMQDMLANHDRPEEMGQITQELLFDERPDAVMDWIGGRENRSFYRQLDPMFYRIGDLASVVRQRRANQGKTIADKPYDSWNKEAEWGTCVGLARPVWRTLVQRLRPEWLKNPTDYCPPTFFMTQVYYPGERTARRRVIGSTILSDTVVLDLYKEATETGVKGIGLVGRQDLRTLLSDEHPELN